jgi:hypothetical protein
VIAGYALALPLAKTGEAAKAGPIGLAVILLLCIVCYFLFKSMSKHLRKVRDNFPVDPNESGKGAQAAEAAERAEPVDPAEPADKSRPTDPPT